MLSFPIKKKVAVIGGTGKEGKGIAFRLVNAGYMVFLGSRMKERAIACALELQAMIMGEGQIQGTDNIQAVRQADIIILTVPYTGHTETLAAIKDEIQGKLLIDVTVPLFPPKITRVQMPPAGSAAQEAYIILGKDSHVTTAFQNISHENLMDPNSASCDVLVTGSSKSDRAETILLVESIGLKAWDAGPLENSVVVEGLTSVLININRIYGSSHAGIMITGIDRSS